MVKNVTYCPARFMAAGCSVEPLRGHHTTIQSAVTRATPQLSVKPLGHHYPQYRQIKTVRSHMEVWILNVDITMQNLPKETVWSKQIDTKAQCEAKRTAPLQNIG